MTIKLLAVDDSKTIRRVLEITLSGPEFQTTIVGSKAEALQALRQDRPQIALVDAFLDGESGYDLCRQLKAEAPELRVLILSSKHRPYDEAQGASAQADAHFDKPFDSQKLIDKVSSLLGDSPVAAAAPPRPVTAPAAQPAPIPLVAAPRPAAPAAEGRAPVAPPPRPLGGGPLGGGFAAPRPPLAGASGGAGTPAPASTGSRPALSPTLGAARSSAPAVVQTTLAQSPAGQAPPAQAPATAKAVQPAAQVTSASSSGAQIQTQLEDKLKGLGLTPAQLEGVLALSREVVEQVVWEVVPVLAETLIQEEIARLTAAE